MGNAGRHDADKLSAEEIAGLKHEVERRQVDVDKAFARFDDFVRKHEGDVEGNSYAGSDRNMAKEKVALLERLMEAMSKSNASYRDYVQVLENKIGF